jgi:hypothetical protein
MTSGSFDLLLYIYVMSSIVINPKNEEELQFVTALLKKLGVASKVLSDEEQEDLGLGLLMKDVDRSDLASEDEVLSKLSI